MHPVTKDGKHLRMNSYCAVESYGDFLNVPVDQVTYMDVSPKQLVSVAASLIPFLKMTTQTVR